MKIAGAMIAAVLVALNVVGAAAQPPMGDGLAHEQMMGMMQQMSAMMGQMAEMLRSGDFTPEHRAKMADVMAQMAQVMRQTTTIMGSRALGFQRAKPITSARRAAKAGDIPGGTPRLVLDREVVDLGYLPFETPARVVFTLTNAGTGSLKLEDVPRVKVLKGC